MRAELHTLRESLSKFPETVGESLPKRIKSADDLHNRARKVAKGNLGELKRFASKHGYGPLQVARNLVATANAKELEILRDLLTSWNQESPLEPASEFRSLCATLPRPGRRITMARWMLLEGRLPARTIAIDYFSGNLQQILDFERVVLRDQSGSLSSANTVSILRAVCSWDLDKFPKNTRALLSAEGFAKDLAQLDEVAFRKVPQRIRRWILEDHDFSASALTADYHDRVRSDPLAFPDSPEAIREQVWISREFPATLQALSSRSFFDLDLQALFQRPNFDECDDQILMALRRRRISSYWDSSCMLLKLPDHGLSAASSRPDLH